jgi:hypothetical protein
MTQPRIIWSASIGIAIGALLSCGDENSEACRDYACSTYVSMSASVERDTADAEFDVRVCNGDECEYRFLPWREQETEVCDGTWNLGDKHVCVRRHNAALEFFVDWSFLEGVPADKTFSLRIVDRADGSVLVDETREAAFGKSPSWDFCHDCWQATIELNALVR